MDEGIGKVLVKEDTNNLVLTIGDKGGLGASNSDTVVVEMKLACLKLNSKVGLPGLFEEYSDAFANSFQDVRPYRVVVKHSFDLTSNIIFCRSSGEFRSDTARLSVRKCHACWKQASSLLSNLHEVLQLSCLPRRMGTHSSVSNILR